MIKTVGVDNDLTIADNLKFVLTTTDSNGCLSMPYKVNKIAIYFISREFTDTNSFEYNREIIDSSLQNQYDDAKKLACDFPTQENIDNLNYIKSKIDNSKFSSPFYFKDAIVVASYGGHVDEVIGVKDRLDKNLIVYPGFESSTYTYDLQPAWLNPDMVPPESVDEVNRNNILQIYTENGVDVDGKFIFEWNPMGNREGDYFICWNWSPNLAGSTLSSHLMFSLGGDSRMTTSIPTHYTRSDKYEILMDRYLPNMFKSFVSDSDLSPYVLKELNSSVAKGFTFLEDLSNQIIDLLDANSIHEQLLPLLSNLFNLKLKTNDPTLWRRQTKKAISNFKKKGTLSGLRSALSDAGVSLLKFTRMWQVVSKYTYQEYFTKTTDSNIFTLSNNVILPINTNHFELWYRAKESNYWQELSSDYVEIQESVGGEPLICTWLEDNLQIGDSFRILYQTDIIPSEDENIEIYIRTLSLMDNRDERSQIYPPKNWNTRVIEEDDPLFDLIIPIKHPIKDKIIWGKVRTEFPYSENIYNMEEYNGSTRDSNNPCDIDKNFKDSCKDCQSSVFTIDVEIEELSNNRIVECIDAIEEFIPFHSLIHTINYVGAKNEFVKPPIEEIIALINFIGEEIMIAGDAQMIFNRSIKKVSIDLVKRNMLASMNDETGLVSGTGFNRKIKLFAPNVSTKDDLQNEKFAGKSGIFNQRNVNINNISGDPLDNSNLLEVLSPSTNAGFYSVSNVSKGSFDIVSQGLHAVIEPIDKSQFEFRISNKIYEKSSVSISQKDLLIFSDEEYDFSKNRVVSQKDIDNSIEVGDPYRIKMTNGIDIFDYVIHEVLPDNKMILEGPDNSDEFYIDKSNISWELIGPTNSISGDRGYVHIVRRGLVDLGSPPINDIRDLARIGDYIFYDEDQYKLRSFEPNENYKFYIEGYEEGNVGGVDIIIYRRIVENCVGQFDYEGLELITSTNYESALLIENGVNSSGVLTKSNRLKENFLILIDSNYYSILDIDGVKIILDGPNNDWTTLGTSVDFTIYRFINQSVSIPAVIEPVIPGHSFDQISRSNNEIIENTIAIPYFASKVLNSINSSDNFVESCGQQETISMNIEYKDGNKEEREI